MQTYVAPKGTPSSSSSSFPLSTSLDVNVRCRSDSSRYFYADGYEERQRTGEPQKQLSKEFVRQWLIEQGFQGLEGQQMPVMPDDFVDLVSQRYIELYEKITGKVFVKDEQEDMIARINNNVSAYLLA